MFSSCFVVFDRETNQLLVAMPHLTKNQSKNGSCFNNLMTSSVSSFEK